MGARKIEPTDKGAVRFYEKEFFMLSNFSAFSVKYDGDLWPTAEHAYQAKKFYDFDIRDRIKNARSPYEAKKIAHAFENEMRDDWEEVKIIAMEEIIWAKLSQHPYIQQKLFETGGRTIIEDSHKDAFWGWGPDKQGENNLGRIWMRLRERMLTQSDPNFFGDTPFMV